MIGHLAPDIREARQLDQERRELEAAMDLVATGRFPAVIVTNLANCRLVVEELRERAGVIGVELELLAHPSDPGCDVSVHLH